MNKLLAAAVLSILAIGSAAHAVDEGSSDPAVSRGGLFVEPLIQVGRTNSSIDTSQINRTFFTDTSGVNTQIGIGAKLGVHVSEMFFVGADARYNQISMNDSSYKEAQGGAYDYGITGGLQTPYWGVRVLASYVLGGQFDPGAGASGVDLKFKDPRGYRLGAGFHIRSVSVNLEYENIKYNTTEVQSVGSTSFGFNSDVDYSTAGYLLSVSFPIEI